MRFRSHIRGLCGPALVVAVTAAGMQLAGGIPAQAASAPAAAPHAGPVRPADHYESATLVLKVREGLRIRIRGGGAGTSNCTKDETDKTVTATAAPLEETISFIAKTSGSCFFESSFSYFDVTAENSDKVVVAAAAVELSGVGVVSYQAYCPPYGKDFNLSCRKPSDNRLELTQTRGGGLKGGRESAELRLFVGGSGPTIKVEGGGSGPDGSNCTNNETTTTVTAGADPTVVPIGFDAKSSGSCAIERSYSFFNITISGTTHAGKPAKGSARILFGQSGSGEEYKTECVSTSPSVTCERIGMRTLQIRYN
jgi:hypothetical protein